MLTEFDRPRPRSRKWRRWVYFSLFLLAATLHIASVRLVSFAESPYPLARTIPYSEVELLTTRASLEPLSSVFEFRSGETLSEVLTSFGLDGVQANRVVGELSNWVDPRKIRPNDQYAVHSGPDGSLEVFELSVAREGRVRVARQEEAWEASWRPYERSVKTRSIQGTLDGALDQSIADAGGEASLAFLLAEVFQWDLDFTRDLRLGDSFKILYERVYLDGVLDAVGSILAVTYENDGRLLEAYRFGEDGAYYDADGRPIRKMFLRSPLRYSRISSRFSKKRFHPILKRYRPHYGVDYGAPTGTPVRATANGTVVSAGWDRGGGKTVKVRHPNSYMTAYLHLSRFAKGVRRGTKVSQGEVVGYVGSTGLSTAPHLDYRVQRHGRWIDPLSLKSVPADPVPHRRLPEFLAWRDNLRKSLFEGVPLDPQARTSNLRLASADPDSNASSTARSR